MNAGTARIVFAGSPEFAVPSLAALLDTAAGRWEIVAVLTQPDRPAGRGRQLRASPVKEYAQGRHIPILQPASLRRDPAAVAEVAALRPDIVIVVAYGLILPQELLQRPPAGCVNVHASLLPRWRGAAPVAAAILAGDSETGVALMKLEAGLDTGPVFASASIPIDASDTTQSLQEKLAGIGARLLVQHLPAILRGDLRPVPQSAEGVTHAAKISKEDARIDWSQPAVQLDRLIRALQPWPVAETRCKGIQLRCWKSALPEATSATGRIGEIVAVSAGGIDVQTGTGLLRLTSVQPANGKPMSAAEYARGHAVLGEVLGQ